MPVVYEDTYKKTGMFGELAPYCDFGTGNKGQASNQALAAAQLSKLIGKTTVVSAASRKSARASEGDKKLQQLASLIESCMDVTPATRISAAAACQHDIFKEVEL